MDEILRLVELIWMVLGDAKRRREQLADARARTVADVERVNAWIRAQPDAVTMPPKGVKR